MSDDEDPDNPMYLRTDDGVRFYRYLNGSERLYLDFSETPTDTNYLKDYLPGRKTDYWPVRGDSSFFRDCVIIENVGFSYDAGFGHSFTKGIGLIEIWWFRGVCYFKSAIVNNVRYPKKY